ncbi:hypothetical protein M9H77_29408 [Catharanthus roseus]|uniref:Uncharacterized protein n=1 Tax=Catharanthus roseus TaxID=4058 RepID=A0ACB9ZV71_CATRO|nr:hypothetical protein M9H77_29408 [Catharanthus roseus]
MTKNVWVFFIRLYGQDIQVKLLSVSECLAIIRRKHKTTSIFDVSISPVLLVHNNPQVSISECLAPIRRKPSATVDAVIFITKNFCVFFICLYGQDIHVKHFLLVHINPQVSLSESLAPIRRRR